MKKIWAFCILFAMCLALLVGCGDMPAENNNISVQPEHSGSTMEEQTEGTSKEEMLDGNEEALFEPAPAGTVLPAEYYERAAQIGEAYGVRILIADQCDTEFSDHTADLLTNEEEVKLALDTIEHVLGQYPRGFFPQLRHEMYQYVEIQVLGVLRKAGSTPEETYISGGFVTTSYFDKLVMALDARAGMPGETINSILEQTMYHEFSHIIDKKLAFASVFYDEPVYSEDGWRKLNPEGFAYNETYYGTLDPQYADCFVDAYACTNETEDRARTMEYAMMQDAGVFEGKDGLNRKLEYYCAGIRAYFDTTGWPEITPWEQMLQ